MNRTLALAAGLSVGALLAAPCLACDEGVAADGSAATPSSAARPIRSLGRVGRSREARVFEKLVGNQAPRLPREARYDASAGVLL